MRLNLSPNYRPHYHQQNHLHYPNCLHNIFLIIGIIVHIATTLPSTTQQNCFLILMATITTTPEMSICIFGIQHPAARANGWRQQQQQQQPQLATVGARGSRRRQSQEPQQVQQLTAIASSSHHNAQLACILHKTLKEYFGENSRMCWSATQSPYVTTFSKESLSKHF